MKITGSEKQYVEISKQILLTCQYNASPPVSEVQWIKDGNVIAKNASVIGNAQVNITQFTESQVQLLITSSTTQDAGNYTCLVINVLDYSSDTTTVIIQGMFFRCIRSLFLSNSTSRGTRHKWMHKGSYSVPTSWLV